MPTLARMNHTVTFREILGEEEIDIAEVQREIDKIETKLVEV